MRTFGVALGLFAMGLAGCYESVSHEPPPVDAGAPSEEDADVVRPPAPPPVRPPSTGAGSIPSVTGGTMALLSSGRIMAAHPGAHAIFLVDPTDGVVATTPLSDLADPGRVLEDGDGRVHIVMRRSGDVLTLDGTDARVVSRRHVCAAPRGIAHEPSTDLLHVACAGGELVSLPAGGGDIVRSRSLVPDLRDVVVGTGGMLYVSRFRSAELLTVNAEGAVVATRRPATTTEPAGRDPSLRNTLTPNVAWRLRGLPDGSVAMLHQRSVSSPIDVAATGYSGSGMCATGVVQSSVSIFGASGAPPVSGAIPGTLLVDMAVANGGDELVISSGASGGRELIQRFAISAFREPCAPSTAIGGDGAGGAVEALADGGFAILEQSPPRLAIVNAALSTTRLIQLGDAVAAPPGYVLFHSATPSMVACASCHPEGGEDGHVWDFQPAGPRRTQTLLGGILGTEPFHWSGDQAHMAAIMNATFVERMGMPPLSDRDIDVISTWIDAQPVPSGSVTDEAAVTRGHALFTGEAGCASCHSGAMSTDNLNHDVGTGGSFQTPSLRGVMHRAPFFHDGCAQTLADVLDGACGATGGHEASASLNGDQRADVVAYLRSL